MAMRGEGECHCGKQLAVLHPPSATEQGTWGLVGLDDFTEAGRPPPRSRQVLAWMAATLTPQVAPAAECARPLLQGPLLVCGREQGFSPKIRGRVKGIEMTGEINEHTTSMFDWRHGGLR